LLTADHLYLLSGLALGWSLGANDAANVFGTAVGTGMVRFKTAAFTAALFLLLGAVIGGAGPAGTIVRLGEVNLLAGAFAVALAAALAVLAMTKAGLPVSVSQAIVGAIIGWNFFAGTFTDPEVLARVLSTWLVCPLLAAVVGALLFKAAEAGLARFPAHMVRQDHYTRMGLIAAGAFGAFALGANNMANVVGVFLPASPFVPFRVGDLFTVTSASQLFFLGGLAAGAGVVTYSQRVMRTVGQDLLPLSPVGGLVVVVSQGVVLLLFASERLEYLLASAGLPTIPLVPVSSSQAVIGAALGVAMVKGFRGLRFRVLGGIALGWVATPLLAGVLSLLLLFVVQNLFGKAVYRPVACRLTPAVAERLVAAGTDPARLAAGIGVERPFETAFRDYLENDLGVEAGRAKRAAKWARIDPRAVTREMLDTLDPALFGAERWEALRALEGRRFEHAWQLEEALTEKSPLWRLGPDEPLHRMENREIQRLLRLVAQAAGSGEAGR